MLRLSGKSDEAFVEREIIERVGQISSELAHDLRSPLQTIQNAVYLLQRNPENPELFDMISQSLVEASSLLDSFRDYYKGHIVKPIQTDFTKIVDLAFSEVNIPGCVEVQKKLLNDLCVNLDPSKMALAIKHLLENAVEAMPEGGVLKLTAFQSKEGIHLSLEDNGTGILPIHRSSMFTPFESGNKKGNGLGVPIAQRIIQSHGGKLVFSTELGKGTKFTISFPSSTVKL